MASILKVDKIRGTGLDSDTISLDGTGNITIPKNITFSGSVNGLTTGKVLQVVSNTNTNTAASGFLLTTTSSSFVAAALSASITPQATSSKIMIMITTNHYRGGSSAFTTYRGSTNLGGSTFGMMRCTGAQGYWLPVSLHHLDSPNTTSAVTYQLYARSESGTLYIGGDGDMQNNIILTEIAG
jgi:hypothetical protein